MPKLDSRSRRDKSLLPLQLTLQQISSSYAEPFWDEGKGKMKIKFSSPRLLFCFPILLFFNLKSSAKIS